MKTLCNVVLSLSLVTSLALPALAQRQQFGSELGDPFVLLQNEGVQKEMHLTTDQAQKVKEIARSVRKQHEADFASVRDADFEERAIRLRQLTKTTAATLTKALGDVLQPDQIKRFQQIMLQQRGAEAFSEPEIRIALKLTRAQQDQLRMLIADGLDEMRDQFRFGPGSASAQAAREIFVAVRKKTMDKAVGVLNDEQKKTWKEMTGEPVEVKLAPTAGRGRNPNQRPRSQPEKKEP
jgi:hypothetical protein